MKAAWMGLLIPVAVAAQTVPLPIHFSLPALLLSREAGAVVEPLDLAALTGARLALVSQEGYSWTATRYRLHGVDISDPYQPGRLLAPVDMETLGEPLLSGAGIALALREPGRAWRGQISSHNTASSLASDNLPSPPQRGAVLQPERFRWWTRNHLEAGGPLGRRADLLASATGQWASQTVPQEPAGKDLNSRLLLGNARTRVTPNPRTQLEASFSGSRLDTSGWSLPAGFEALAARRMAPPLRPHPDLAEDNRFSFVQAGLTRQIPTASRVGSVQARYGYTRARLDTNAERFGTPAYIELTTGAVAGPPPLSSRALRTSHSLQAAFQPGPLRFLSREHGLNLAAEWNAAAIRNHFEAPGYPHAITAEGAPAFVVELNAPLTSRSGLRSFTLLVEDRMRVSRWLSAEAGLLLDAAAATSPAAVSWRNAAPRLGLALTLGPLVLRGNYARRHVALAGRHLDYAGENSLGGLEYRWVDLSGDRLFQPPEKGELLRRFGGPYASISRPLQRSYADEFGVSAEISLPARSFVRLRLFRRDDKDRLAAVNIGVPPESYRPRAVLDPGPDFIPGTFDDQRLVVWEQNSATFGADRFLLASPGLRAMNKGLTAQVGTTHESFQYRLSFLAVKSLAAANPGNEPWENDPGVIGSLYQDPNTLIHASGRSFFDRAYAGKLAAGWRAPRLLGGLDVGAVVTYMDGLVFGRRLLVKDLAQGPMLVAATVRGSPEGGHRTQYYLSWDLRAGRSFGALQVHADVFNLLNRSSRLREDDLSGPLFNQRLPLAIQPARFVRLGVSYEF